MHFTGDCIDCNLLGEWVWPGAWVGVGILKGIPRYWFSEIYHNISRSQRFGIIDLPRCTKIPRSDLQQTVLRFQDSPDMHPKFIRNWSGIIRTSSKCFKTYSRCTMIYLVSQICLAFKDFIEIPPPLFLCLSETIEIEDCLGPTKQ